jgi:hypothetical protein
MIGCRRYHSAINQHDVAVQRRGVSRFRADPGLQSDIIFPDRLGLLEACHGEVGTLK